MMKNDYPRLWNSWRAMKERCNNENNKAYKYYGEKELQFVRSGPHLKHF